jgi:hypothetical protein
VNRSAHPLQAIVVAAILALVPYLLLTGSINRLARRRVQSIARTPHPESRPVDAPEHRRGPTGAFVLCCAAVREHRF